MKPDSAMDSLTAIASSWNDFYRQNRPGVPFLRNVPDENLVEWISTGKCRPGRALDVGCGFGRNSIFLAQNGWQVSALDLSAEALVTARTRAREARVDIEFAETHLFGARWSGEQSSDRFDLIYDSGCLHHLPPAEREHWLNHYAELLQPGNQLGLVAFAPESGAPIDSDRPPMTGSRTGWSFTADGLCELLSAWFEVDELRRMRPMAETDSQMGVDFLWVVLAHRR
jgi:SAM-dependent methyltransferase